MTGYGVADGRLNGGRIQAEVRTVNHRHFNLSLKVPSGLQDVEGELRQRLRDRLARGHVSVAIRWIEEPERDPVISVNLDRAQDIVEALRELQSTLDLAGDIDVAFVSRQPDVISITTSEDAPIDVEELRAILDRAVDDVLAMRADEGAVLGDDVQRLLDDLRGALDRIETHAPGRVERELDRLRANVQALVTGQPVDETRLSQEIALLADKLDISEETVRLRAHFDACARALAGDDPAGRRLAFLGQEMLREINTIGSKANDAAIAHEVVGMKGTVEKFREQVENVE